ncbi:MAG: hypothetical protein H7141_04870 [Burkholderiales bacterium]|nr:hypothetical protein [Bacteroidia bacterium]
MTTENLEHLEAIQDIRQMMKKSTRFLSLSGLSGVFAGIFALAGAVVGYLYLNSIYENWVIGNLEVLNRNEIYLNFILIAAIVLILSISTAYFFSNRKAKREGQNLFDHTAIRVLINLAIPLIAGGIFCIALLYHGAIVYIAPAMLLFYGLALINASKYTYDDIRYFGLCEILLGLINAFNLGNGLLYWALGFGVLHIVYGMMMWFKYEKKR